MTDAPTHRWLYLDFDSFFASAEQHFSPALRGKPVAVVPLDVAHTACIAISREAKAAGVKGHSRVRDARTACAELVFVVARPDAYVRLHRRVLRLIETVLPVTKVKSIDEVVCALPPERDADATAAAIKAAIRDGTSPVLTASIGIAPSPMLAKVAAEMDKPDGYVRLDPSDLPQRIAHLALTDLPGISDGMAARLAKAGIATIPDLWATSAKQARALWGSIEGERFWNALHGLPYERPASRKAMFGHSRMLPFDWRDEEGVRACARQLLLGAARRLRRSPHRASKLSLSMRGFPPGERRAPDRSNERRWSTEILFDPARDDRALLAALDRALAKRPQPPGFVPRSVSVMLHGLVPRDDPQPGLFAAAHDAARTERERLSDTLDALRAQFGPKAAAFGWARDMPGGYLGAKIAFGRIPDDEDFNEAQTADGATQFAAVAGR